MAFNQKTYKRAEYEPRAQVIKTPELAEYFEEGEAAEFMVRSLTGQEIAVCTDAFNKHNLIIQALESSNVSKEDVKKLFGNDQKSTPESMRDFKMLGIVLGFELETAKKIFKDFPAVFKRLTSAIWILTDQGSVKKKQNSSTVTQE